MAQRNEALSADECRALVSLDPFWTRGQSASLAGRGHSIIPEIPYGVASPGGGVLSVGSDQITSNWTQATDQTTRTYQSTVEDVVGTSSSEGLDLGFIGGSGGIGLKGSITLSQGSSLDTSTAMNITYRNSTATKYEQGTTIDGVVKDTTYRGYLPGIEIYQD